MAFSSGFIVVINLIFNSRLAKKTDVFLSTFSNYLIAVVVSVVLVFSFSETTKIGNLPDISVIYYLGGLFGALVVIIFNMIVHKIPIIYSTILAFSGQLLMGIVLDLIIGNQLSKGKIAGLILITAGLIYNMNIDRKLEKSNKAI
jgi:uncharacterized membrane protein YdcZ (DUF606 family)